MTHYYNEETGSNNISKASPEWKEIWDEAKNNQSPDRHPLHAAYEEVNRRIAAGESWAKCANCGSPYQLTMEWSNNTVCSLSCHNDYLDYMNSI